MTAVTETEQKPSRIKTMLTNAKTNITSIDKDRAVQITTLVVLTAASIVGAVVLTKRIGEAVDEMESDAQNDTAESTTDNE
jgi:hypothetical protein